MVEKRRHMSLWIFLNIGIGAAFLIAAAITVVAVNKAMRRQAVVEAESKARIILDRNFATHTYFSQIMKPSIFEWAKPILTKEYFDPTWMSSTYAIREIEKYFKKFNPSGYYFRDVAVNARSPENEAETYERMFLEKINADEGVQAESVLRTMDGEPYLVVLRRSEIMERSCLRCHGDPKDAPAGLVDIYGPTRSFHRKLGEVVSAVSLRIPIADAYQAADAFSWRLSGILFMVLAALFMVQYALYRRYFIHPLGRIQKKANLIASSQEHLGEQIRTPFGKELRELTAAFNAMSATLRHDRDHLEETVEQRTADLTVASQQYRRERDFADSLLQTAQAIVVLLDFEGRIVRVNRYFEELTGYQMEELEGRDWFTTFLPETDRERIRDVFVESVGDIQTKGSINPILTKDGRLREIEWYDKTLKDAEGRVMGLLSTGVDMTDRLRAEDTRLAMERKVQQAEKRESLITMAGAIAHHFNNQLTTVLGYLEMARKSVSRTSDLGEYLLESENAAKRSAELSRLMLIYVGLGEHRTQRLHLTTLMREMIPDLRSAMPKSVRLETDVPASISPIMMDPGEIRQIITNLVTNAWESIGKDGGTVRVVVRPALNEESFEGFNPTWETLENGPRVCLEVNDTGPGMDRKTLERVFDPFFTTKFTGRGLGMAVALGIVRASDGAIFVKSAPGQGTTVRVFFPACPEASSVKGVS
ncbi:MAG: DUF3365 domain-containing protein [Deltaproteobacteria bacterium]|nr:DUF3365 domain-containing protein [Deltaproteobacteria bacterium]